MDPVSRILVEREPLEEAAVTVLTRGRGHQARQLHDLALAAQQPGQVLAAAVYRRRQERALEVAVRVQQEFEAECRCIGRKALDFSDQHDVVPVAVLVMSATSMVTDFVVAELPALSLIVNVKVALSPVAKPVDGMRHEAPIPGYLVVTGTMAAEKSLDWL